jgi:hypothetical protein
MQKPAYFDVDGKTTNFVNNLGDLKDAVYSAASTSRAGTITELTGINFLKTNIKDPATRAIVNNFNDALNFEAESYLSPLNVASILTDDLRKYDSKSFTFDRAEADRNPKKILATIDPVTQMTTLDESGKYYKQQYDEAKNFIKTKILSKMDNERKISTTGQLSESEEARQRAGYKYRTGSGEAPPPVVLGEIQRISSEDGKVNGVVVGLENLKIAEAKGIENIAKSVGWNRVTGTVELRGYQASGKEDVGNKTTIDDGMVDSSGKNVVEQKEFVSSDKKNSRLLTLFAPKMPNPNRPGYNFRNVAELRNYLIERDKETGGSPVSIGTSTTQTGNKELD